MTNQNNPKRTVRSMVALAPLTFALALLALPIGNQGETNPNVASMPADKCVARALIEVVKIQYQGKDSGNDKVYVEWRDGGASPCVYFGGGFDVPGQSNIAPFGYEVTVKVTRKNGHEDSGKLKSALVVNGNQVLTEVITIPRGLLETDPVSFEVKVRTTVGLVMTQTNRLTGNGTPVLMNATQKFTPHSSVANVLGTCFPLLQVPALDFLPGSGATPDRVTVGLNTGLPQLAESCFDQPKVSIVVRLTRPNGVVDAGQANVAAGDTTTTIPISGTPGSVTSFEIIVTASAGSVIEKSVTSTGAF
jgi:hypothetical protein